MRWFFLAAVSALALLGVASGAEARKPVRCISDHLLASSDRAVVFTHGSNLYGCVRGAKAARLLAYRFDDGVTDADWLAPAVAGVFAAYGEKSGSKCSVYYVSVRNLRTGRIVHASSAGTHSENTAHGDCSGLPVAKIVLFGDGVAIYTVGAGSVGYELCVLGPGGQRVLSVGPDMDPLSLRRVGTGVTWWQGGEWRTYTRPG